MRHRFLSIAFLITAITAAVPASGATDYLSDAERLVERGELKAAEIQLKNAVRSDPKNMLAHYRLAVVELQLGDAAAAEHEASTAQAGGYDPERIVPLLAQTYLAQQKYRQLLQDFPGTDGSAMERAGVLVERGKAQLALGNAEEARASFHTARNLAPDTTGPLIAEANLLLSEQKFAAAEPLFSRVLELDPKSNDARLGKAHLLRMTGNSGGALSRLDELVSDNPRYAAARLARAEILIAQDKDNAAKSDVDAVVALQPRSIAGTYLSAVLATKSRDFERADSDLQKIARAMPSIPRGYYLQAFIAYNLRHLEQAEDAARRHVARYPDELTGGKLLGQIELSLGRPADTIEALSKFESDGKADSGALDLLGRAYTQVGKTAEALSAFSAAIKLSPTDATLRTRLGGLELQTGHTAEAIRNLEQSLDLAPSTPAAEMLVLTQLAAGNWQDAIDTAKKLEQAEPNTPTAGNLLGLINLARFDLEPARMQFAELVKKYPKFLPAYFNLARVLELEGQQEESAQALRQVLEQQPTNGSALTRLVDLLIRNSQADAAVAAAERAHAAAPTNQGITAGLIDLYLRRGVKDKALEVARQEYGRNDKADAPLIAARARAEFAAGLKTEAAVTYRRLIELAPKRIELRRHLAATLLDVGDIGAAQHEIDSAMEIAPYDSQLAADRIAIELKKSGVDGAVVIAGELQTKYPKLPTAAALQGDAFMAAGEYAKAAAAYAETLQRNPSGILAVRLARAKSAEGNADAAAGVLREWLVQHPDDDAVAGLLATYDLVAHRFDEASKALEQLVTKAPQNAVALNNLAWLYHRVSDPRARTLAERAYLIAPELPQTADTLGWILVQQGEAAKAIGLLKHASESGSATATPAIRYHLAVALKDVGRPTEAIQLLTELVSGSASFDEKPEAEKLLNQLSKG